MLNLNKVLTILTLVSALNIGLSQTAVAEEMACSIAPNGPCTMDINVCGNASICTCPNGYSYNAAIAQCVIEDIAEATSASTIAIEGSCVGTQPVPCTRDINRCGHPSRCMCPEGLTYNPVVGKCLKDL